MLRYHCCEEGGGKFKLKTWALGSIFQLDRGPRLKLEATSVAPSQIYAQLLKVTQLRLGKRELIIAIPVPLDCGSRGGKTFLHERGIFKSEALLKNLFW